jgi:hypothetical protein
MKLFESSTSFFGIYRIKYSIQRTAVTKYRLSGTVIGLHLMSHISTSALSSSLSRKVFRLQCSLLRRRFQIGGSTTLSPLKQPNLNAEIRYRRLYHEHSCPRDVSCIRTEKCNLCGNSTSHFNITVLNTERDCEVQYPRLLRDGVE